MTDEGRGTPPHVPAGDASAIRVARRPTHAQTAQAKKARGGTAVPCTRHCHCVARVDVLLGMMRSARSWLAGGLAIRRATMAVALLNAVLAGVAESSSAISLSIVGPGSLPSSPAQGTTVQLQVSCTGGRCPPWVRIDRLDGVADSTPYVRAVDEGYTFSWAPTFPHYFKPEWGRLHTFPFGGSPGGDPISIVGSGTSAK